MTVVAVESDEPRTESSLERGTIIYNLLVTLPFPSGLISRLRRAFLLYRFTNDLVSRSSLHMLQLLVLLHVSASQNATAHNDVHVMRTDIKEQKQRWPFILYGASRIHLLQKHHKSCLGHYTRASHSATWHSQSEVLEERQIQLPAYLVSGR
ncbi:hypothetical protein ZEAMMB73_Zm00001d037665 [Zea mays]|uniref:Uncharacterized protein n=1 Tax=Zea mays TaxID=4577 RepID=A0A1D6LZN9_MAIZE|nr:hypothetical protein ZEAMMB73_Zm00001d037665 [Zea mays]